MPRKKPFSGKQKKLQLQEKRRQKDSKNSDEEIDDKKHIPTKENRVKIGKIRGPNRLVSEFDAIDDSTLLQRKAKAMEPLHRLPITSLETSFDAVYDRQNLISVPKRPEWTAEMSKEELESNERRYFENWLNAIREKYKTDDLSYFEKNLEVWRQLWRVCEISDILLVVVDVRHPVLHFPPSLYNYVVNELKRKIVVVFMKIDLVSENVLQGWIDYFKHEFPEVEVAGFSIYPTEMFQDSEKDKKEKKGKNLSRKRYYKAVGVADLFSKLKHIQLNKPSLHLDWNAVMSKISREGVEFSMEESDDEHEDAQVNNATNESVEESRARDDLLTIGFVGHPNVGKSSLINGIMGRKVVSASRSPGHTKHFQTIHINEKVRLCDCPGLVFPSLVSKQLQILSGLFPIAQVRDPYYSLLYLVERLPVEEILGLELPEDAATWSAWLIAEQFAVKRGYFTAKGARPDVYRAANQILRLVCDGRIILSFKPPGYFSSAAGGSENFTIVSSVYDMQEDEEDQQKDDSDSTEDECQEPLNIQTNPYAYLMEE